VTNNEVVIDEQRCFGCGYCVQFCPRECLEMSKDKISRRGHYQPVFTKPEKCDGCGFCVWMCPHWAIVVTSYIEGKNKAFNRRPVAGPPRLALEPPLAGCPGCQHPTVGRIIAEVLDEMGVGDKTNVLEAIPCAISSVFGMDFGCKLTLDKRSSDVATHIRRSDPDSLVIAVQGYWGLADFSFDVGSLIGALIRGEKITMIMCNMPFHNPKYGRPAPASEPAQGILEPATMINTPSGKRLLMGGYPLHIAELSATFNGVGYSARGALSSVKEYQRTKGHIRKAIQNQMEGNGLSLVEIITVCGDLTYTDPVDSLEWVREKMTVAFPLGEFMNTRPS
jgi:2-oxoglutarate ferredoxin oxidoreductase subunit beta